MSGRGKIDSDGVAGVRASDDGVRRQKFGDREARQPQKMPRSPRAIILANNFDSHGKTIRDFQSASFEAPPVAQTSVCGVPSDLGWYASPGVLRLARQGWTH
jgi:hypothetical protein